MRIPVLMLYLFGVPAADLFSENPPRVWFAAEAQRLSMGTNTRRQEPTCCRITQRWSSVGLNGRQHS
jgi:hypothetical protein